MRGDSGTMQEVPAGLHWTHHKCWRGHKESLHVQRMIFSDPESIRGLRCLDYGITSGL